MLKESEKAFAQIESRKYALELKDFSVDKTIKLAIAFFGTDLEYSSEVL